MSYLEQDFSVLLDSFLRVHTITGSYLPGVSRQTRYSQQCNSRVISTEVESEREPHQPLALPLHEQAEQNNTGCHSPIVIHFATNGL